MKGNSAILKRIGSERCAVLGLGKSNRPLIEFLLDRGASVTAYDQKSRDALGAYADYLQARGVHLVLGERYLDEIAEDIIFRSPGIRPDAKGICSAISRGALLTSEMELFLDLCPGTSYAITGSDGKTTTTTLTYLFLSEQAKRDGFYAHVGGNIGAPLLPYVAEIEERDVAVIELSSFQLMGMRVHPDAIAITNITPNHLNWHTDMDEYIEAKRSICGENTRLAVLNADCPVVSKFDFGEKVRTVYFSSSKCGFSALVPSGKKNAMAFYIKDGCIVADDGEKGVRLLALSGIKLPGKHNVENYMTAIALTYGKVDIDIYTEIAASFGGVEHRIELCGVVGGAEYYNSSIDSTPTRTAAALSAFSCRPIVICGGYDKKIPFEPLADVLCHRASAVVLNGATAEKIYEAIVAHPAFPESGLKVLRASSLHEAVLRAHSLARSGDVVLFSPACASFDAFRDFEERGNAFKSFVKELMAKEN